MFRRTGSVGGRQEPKLPEQMNLFRVHFFLTKIFKTEFSPAPPPDQGLDPPPPTPPLPLPDPPDRGAPRRGEAATLRGRLVGDSVNRTHMLGRCNESVTRRNV